MLQLTNTLTGRREVFEPLDPPWVRMYNCGPTVYSYAHIGNLRSYVFADILRRTLELNDYEVKQVINITDVGHLTTDEDQGEDKIEAEARRQHKTAAEIAAYYTEAFFRDLKQLNIKTQDTHFPRASDHIPEQLELIRTLEEKGLTYQTATGVYFDTARFPAYGRLGQINHCEAETEARVASDPDKRHPADFALWKFSSPAERRQQEWDSPWGRGYPGWHLECSAMAMKYLGPTLDIHTGGIDHIPVHHNNEIAQSEGATDQPFARYWLHQAFVDIKGDKMAKSAGNFITLRDLEEQGFLPASYRWWLLTAHYRSPISFSPEALSGVQRSLHRLVDQLSELPAGGQVPASISETIQGRLNDDLDTPSLIADLWATLKDTELPAADRRTGVEAIISALGMDLTGFGTETVPLEKVPARTRELLEARRQAREQGDYAQADDLREQIAAEGYLLQDTSDGQVVSQTKSVTNKSN